MVSDELEQQIREARRSISADGYPMSIGELTNMYRDRELIIRPEFQRFFRWSDLQKSRLVESILLGIPLPSIFVAQTESGQWEVVDGLQRLSTILQLQGELRDEQDRKHKPFVLVGTKFLPALEGRQWNAAGGFTLTDAQKLDVKRAKIDLKIIKRDSSPEAKFDLFHRLNAYGSQLTAQETRSALLVATSSEFFAWVERLAAFKPFRTSTLLSERLMDERYDVELVLRFLTLHARPAEDFKQSLLRDFSDVLDQESVKLAQSYPHGSDRLRYVFEATFAFINEHGSDNTFRKWDTKQREFRGSFLNTSFEVFGLGVGFHVSQGSNFRQDLEHVVKEFWSSPRMKKGFATGRSTEARLTEFVPLGRILLEVKT